MKCKVLTRPRIPERIKAFYYLEEDCDAPEYLQHVWGDSWKADYVNCRNVGSSFTDDDIDTFVAKEN